MPSSSFKKSLPNAGVLIAVILSVAALSIVIYKETRAQPTRLSTAEGNFSTDKNYLLYEHERRVHDFENRIDKLETRQFSDLSSKVLGQVAKREMIAEYTKITAEGTNVSLPSGVIFTIPKSIRNKFTSLEMEEDYVVLSDGPNGGTFTVQVSFLNEGFTKKQDPQLADCPELHSPEWLRAAQLIIERTESTPTEVCQSLKELAYEPQDLPGCFKKPKEEWLPKMYAYRYSPTGISYLVDPNVGSYTRPEMVIGIRSSSEADLDVMIKSFESTAKIYSTLAFMCAG